MADSVSNRRPLRGTFRTTARSTQRTQPTAALNLSSPSTTAPPPSRSFRRSAASSSAPRIGARRRSSPPSGRRCPLLTVPSASMLTTEFSGSCKGWPSPRTGGLLRVVRGGRSRAGLPWRCPQRAARKCVRARAGRCVRSALNWPPLVDLPMSVAEGCRPDNRLTGYDPLPPFAPLP